MINMQEALINTRAFTIPLEAIKIKSNSLFEIEGKLIKVTKTAFKDLLKLVGITNKTLNHLNDTVDSRAGYAVVKEVMSAIATKQKMKVSLYIDEQDLEVKRIALEGSGIGKGITPAAIQELIEFATESTNRTTVTDTFITDGGTKVTFNLRWEMMIPLKLPGEEIKLGKQISWDLLGDTLVSDYAERLVCTNGMTAIRPGAPTVLNAGSDPSAWYKQLFQDIMNPNRELVGAYEQKVHNASVTNLSVNEFNKIRAFLVDNWKGDMEMITRYLGRDDWKHAYASRGIDLENATVAQLRNCPTPVNAWEAINCITDLASHTYNSVVSDGTKKYAQKFAGRLLNKNWDEEAHISNTPTFRKNK